MSPAERLDLGDGLVGWATGDGETVAWLHGYTMDSSLWAELWQRLPRFRHVGIDLPGHGASRALRPGDSLAGIAAALLAACGALNATRLVGLSLGSLVALQAALAPSNRLQRLVLAAPVIGGTTVEASAQQKNIDLLRTYRGAGRGPPRSQALADLWLRSPPDIFKEAEGRPALFAAIRAVVERHSWQELETGIMRGWAEASQPASSLARISARTLILVGDEDMPGFRRNAHHLARLIPGCERRYLPGLGHLPLLVAPDVCAPLLEAHLGP